MDKTGTGKTTPSLGASFARKGSAALVLKMRGETGKLLSLIQNLADPELGPVGAQLSDRFRAAACRIDIDQNMKMLAVHTSFVYPPSPRKSGFENMIYLGPGALKNRERHFAALVHEATHATQTAFSPILHASPFNAATTLILCPRDFVMACERAEQDAYMRQALFASLLRQAQPDINPDFTAFDPVPAPLYEALRKMSTPVEALRQAAIMMLARPGFSSLKGDEVTLAESYHELALTAYQKIIDARLAANPNGLRFVRMEACDILDIGRSYGPSLFGDNDQLLPAFAQTPQLSPHNQALLDKLNAKLGITDENNLPSFGAALKAQGTTREAFLADSRRPYQRPSKARPCP